MIHQTLLRGPGVANITNTKYVKYMNPIISCELDAESLENSQCFLTDAWESPTDYYAMYAGANTQDYVYPPDGRTYNNNDQCFLAIKSKSNSVRTGWNKVLDVNGKPKPVFQPSFVSGRFDEFQAWIRTSILEGTTLHAWFVGDPLSGSNRFKVGYATSTDYGLTWTKSGTTPVYSDSSLANSYGIIICKVVFDGTYYWMFYCGVDPNVSGYYLARSTNKTTWTKTNSNILQNQNYGWPCDLQLIGGIYYLWTQRNFQTGSNFGPAREIVLLTSADLINWTFVGTQLYIRPSQEFGIGNSSKVFQKPNGQWFMLHTYYINRIQALAGPTQSKEPSTGIKIAEIASSSFIANSFNTYEYPDFVVFHAPLGFEMRLVDVISNVAGSVDTGNIEYAELQFPRLTSAQTLTFANLGVINGGHFAVKMRVQIITSGTLEIFRIGNDIRMTIETGKLRVRLSSNGSGYEKDYITTANIAKPSGLDYEDNHIYVGFIWDGTNLRLFNDFVEFTSGEITKTVDTSLTNVNNSGGNITVNPGATMELGRISILNSPTVNEYLYLDI